MKLSRAFAKKKSCRCNDVVAARRRGRPKVNKDGVKRKRNMFYRDLGFVPPPLPDCVCFF